ncbi:prolyl oligopeptidase family serine peptidase [soil metagenome]
MIISSSEIVLTRYQEQLINKGWGSDIISGTISKKIVYRSDELEVNGYLSHPLDISKKYPLVIWNRGGYSKDGSIDTFLARGIFGEIASWGYVVLASMYRSNEEFGGKDLNDVLNLIPLAEEIEFCDTGKIGMEGWSRGGMMAYLAATKTDRINCCTIISGLADLERNKKVVPDISAFAKQFFKTTDPGTIDKMRDERSAVKFFEKINKKTNFLLIHGKADERISYLDSSDMYEKLKSTDHDVELKLIDGGDHYLNKQKKEVSQIRKSFLEKNLQ